VSPASHRRARPRRRPAVGAALLATALTVGTGGIALVARGGDGAPSEGVFVSALAHADVAGGKARAGALPDEGSSDVGQRRRYPLGRGALPARGRPAPLKVVKAGPPIARIPRPAPSDPFTFRVGTFNILGSQHTRGSNRWAAGTTRAGFTASLVHGYGLDLVGFQEVQDDQLNVLNARLAGYTVWPSRALGNNGVRLQIAFRDSMFELVGTSSFITVFDHQYRPIPVVLLRNRVTGGEFYFMTSHNSPWGMTAERAAAKRVEIAQINGLLATGRPVIISGDMNEKAEFFCQVGSATGMVAANGGSPSSCVLPPPPVKIDWIMGGGGVSFSGYALGAGGLVARASDHEFPHATVTVTP
jgi:endonuclease/exonuclease/phosphatase family metal-dependent hydrolase